MAKANSTAAASTTATSTTAASQGPTPSTLRIGKRYRASRLKGPYDVIVIGSGIGGLTTASLLSEKGKKVLVLEQHYTAGGFTHSYDRNGYEWDVGVHYIGDMGANTIAKKVMDRITGRRLRWAPMDACYDRGFFGDETFDFIAGKDQFIAQLEKRFPQERSAIQKYMRLLSKIGGAMQMSTMAKLIPPSVSGWIKPLTNLVLPKEMNQTTYEVLRGLTSDETLISILCTQWGDYGVPPRESSFLIHALVARHYLFGGYYPIGGASQMAATIIPSIQASGGEVFTYARVQEILVENGKAAGVVMEEGTVIRAPIVVSSAGVLNTFEKLVPQATRQSLGLETLAKQVKPSCGHLGMYIGLKEDAAALQLPRTNYWIFPDYQHDKNMDAFFKDPSQAFPVVYVSFPSAKDPSFSKRYPGRSTIEIVAPVPSGAFDAWADKPWGKRGDDYEALKEQYAQRMLAALYEKVPQIKGKIDYYEVSTPLSTNYFCAYQHGEVYGLNHDTERFSQSWLQVQTQLPGLYLTGQDILSCGVVGAMMAGCVTSIKVLGLEGIKLAYELLGPSKKATTRRASTAKASP